MAEERLQKILAHAGIASRRKAEEYIVTGRVSVNGEIVTELGTKADPDQDHVKVDGKLIRQPKQHVYLALNKPRDVVTTTDDPQGRETVMHLLKGVKQRVYPVGRLDYHSEGLLLLTTDGDLANKIMSPKTHLEKTYHVKINGNFNLEQQEEFARGIALHGRRTAPAKIKILRHADNPWFEVKLTEGRQNQIRLMFQYFGRLVEKLRRVRVGPIDLGKLRVGEFRHLDEKEVARLRKAVGLEAGK